MEIVLIGPTGGGKSTLASALSAKYDIPHISSGDIARELAQSDAVTKTALRVGDYAPEEAIRHSVRTRIERASVESGGYILEGFPRKIAQLVALMNWVKTDPLYLYLQVDTLTCIRRLADRARDNDTPDAVARRLEAFATDTQPLIDALFPILYTLDGAAEPDAIFEHVCTLLS